MVRERLAPAFFVVGTGRCGTTMVRKLLSAHPCVTVPQETHWIPLLKQQFSDRAAPSAELLAAAEDVYSAKGFTWLDRIMRQEKRPGDLRVEWLERLSDHASVDVRQFQEAFYATIADRAGVEVCGDKTPDYGLCMDVLHAMWPDARFLHISRDGRDVALSMTQVLSFRVLAAWGISQWWTIARGKRFQERMDEAVAEQPVERFYELWRKRIVEIRNQSLTVPSENYLEIKYEELLAEPMAVLRRLQSFLRLPDGSAWITEAASQIRVANLSKNLAAPDYWRLTQEFGESLSALGWADRAA